jgi:hypothetical protein
MNIKPIKETIKSILGFVPVTPPFIYKYVREAIENHNEAKVNAGLDLNLDLVAWGARAYVKKEKEGQ